MMKIVGFGDSFILNIVPDNPNWLKAYQGLIGDHYDTVPEFHGKPGAGPWQMFFDWLEYTAKQDIDVCIMAWSEASRLYHPFVVPLCAATAIHRVGVSKETPENHIKVIDAAKEYYIHIMDHRQKDYELQALMTMVDEMTKDYPDIKFIHLHCFSKHDMHTHWLKLYPKQSQSDLEYFYRFKYGAEVRPALMYASMADEWPYDLAHDNRECHMTPRMNKLVADAIIECIDNYHPGKLVEMNVDQYK